MENVKQRKSLRLIVEDFLNSKTDAVAALAEIYEAVEKNYETDCSTWKESTRAVVIRDKNIERVSKGVYFLKGKKSASLLINGDSRNLSEIENGAISGCIITDHPWQDKKNHTSGNQKSFADYETFVYQQEDFYAKARVLQDGCFCAEFLPVESASNWEYLSRIKEMAKKAGLDFYAQVTWRKAPEGIVNTGRTTKGVEQCLIFSKGKPRRLAPTGKPYMTRHILSYEIDIPANKGKQKNHQAEKPIELYEYLIENLTEEQEVCLDQFGGACNMAQASINLNRFSIVYELSKKFMHKAIDRFKAFTVYEPEDISEEVSGEVSEEPVEMIHINFIPAESTQFQMDYLKKVVQLKPELLIFDDRKFIMEQSEAVEKDAERINQIFNQVNKKGYSQYKRLTFDIGLANYAILQGIYMDIQKSFEEKYPDTYTRGYYQNYKIELESFAEFMVTKAMGESIEDMKDPYVFGKYLDFVESKNETNIVRTRKIITEFAQKQSVA